jgi:hypothetical protein
LENLVALGGDAPVELAMGATLRTPSGTCAWTRDPEGCGLMAA